MSTIIVPYNLRGELRDPRFYVVVADEFAALLEDVLDELRFYLPERIFRQGADPRREDNGPLTEDQSTRLSEQLAALSNDEILHALWTAPSEVGEGAPEGLLPEGYEPDNLRAVAMVRRIQEMARLGGEMGGLAIGRPRDPTLQESLGMRLRWLRPSKRRGGNA